MKSNLIVVCGGGGFIGGHLVAELLRQGHRSIRAVDLKPPGEWLQHFPEVESLQLDLRAPDACAQAVTDATSVFNFAADDGGAGFTAGRDGLSMRSVLINTQLLVAAQQLGVARYFFASCSSISRLDLDLPPDASLPLWKAADARSSMPEDGHGWEKLFSERLCREYREDFGIETRVARFSTVYGPLCSWTGGRERAPAAICRKVIEAVASGRREIEIWGDGRQTRSFQYIDDAIEATQSIMSGEVAEPVLLGGGERVSINQLVDLVEEIAGVKLKRAYNMKAPQGAGPMSGGDPSAGNNDLGFKPKVRLRDGLERTYRWIHDEIARTRLVASVPVTLRLY